MDARELLRRYLEQRRELGESEFVLDQLTVEDALAALGVKGGAPARAAEPAHEARVAERPAARPAERPIERTAEAPPRELPPPPPADAPERGADLPSDWREALRATGADKPSSLGPRPSAEKAPTPGNPEPKAESREPTAEGEAPTGIVVGGQSLLAGPMAHHATLDELAKAVHDCTRCPLYRTATHGVPGEGDPNADFMVVGEAPGANEDETGRPFVGQAGQLLTKILGAINLSRDEVFIANVLKHRPPGNRNPMPDEVAACSPYLLRQIELVRPRVILALGTFAAQTLLDTKLAIGKLRGQVHRYHGVPLVVTYHPAALLRNPAWKRPTWEDVQLARRILDRAVPRA